MWPFSERRSSPRWRVAMNVIYGVRDEMQATTSLDVSADSISLHAREWFPPGTVLDVHLDVDGHERWIKVKGKVIRAGDGIISVQFLNLGKREIEDLGHYLRALQQIGKSDLISV